MELINFTLLLHLSENKCWLMINLYETDEVKALLVLEISPGA